MCCISEAKNTYINDWYTKKYPTDEMGQELKDNLSFYDLFEALDSHEEIYEKFGINDTLVRERLFEKLSKIMKCDYDEIYDQWLSGNKHNITIIKGVNYEF